MYRIVLIAAVIAALGFAVYLWTHREPTPAQKLAALAKEVRPRAGEVFETTLQGKPVAFLVESCKVYLLDASGKEVQRTKVLRPGFYPWLTACTAQTIRVEDGFVIVNLENRALGAGGGNTSGGLYRSTDGQTWEKETPKGWLPVAEAQA